MKAVCSPPLLFVFSRFAAVAVILFVAVVAPAGDPPIRWIHAGHYGFLNAVVSSPDGSTFASAGWDRSVKIWSTADGAYIRSLQGHTGAITGLAYSPIGDLIASASQDGTIRVSRTTDATLVRVIQHPSGSSLRSVAWSPNGEIIAGCISGGIVALWTASDGVLIRELTGQSGGVSGPIAFSPSGEWIAYGDFASIHLWRVSDGAWIWTTSAGGAKTLAFSPAGDLLASAGSASTISLWRVADGTLSGSLGTQRANSVAISADGSMLVAAGQVPFSVHLWDLESGTEIRTFPGHANPINAVAFSSDAQRVLSADMGGTLKEWKTSDATLVQTNEWVPAVAVAMSPDGGSVASAASASGTGITSLRFWNPADGAPLASAPGTVFADVDYSRDGTRLAAAESFDKRVSIWRVSDGTRLFRLSGHTDWVSRVAFAPDGGSVLSGSDDGTARLWSAVDGTLLKTLAVPGNYVDAVAYSPSGEVFAAAFSTSMDDAIIVWDATDYHTIASWPAHHGVCTDIAFSPDGRSLVSASRYAGQRIKIWRWQSGTFVREFGGPAQRISLSSNGRRLLSTGDEGVGVWSIPDGTLLAHYDGEARRARSVSWAPGGSAFMCGRDDTTIFVAENEFACNACDANCDGSVNQFDIQPFLGRTSGTPGCSPCAGDMNADGTTNLFDIQAFVVCLSG